MFWGMILLVLTLYWTIQYIIRIMSLIKDIDRACYKIKISFIYHYGTIIVALLWTLCYCYVWH